MRRRHCLLGLSFCAMSCLSSCCTEALWRGAGHHDRANEVIARVLLTPFALLADCLLLGLTACSESHCGSCR